MLIFFLGREVSAEWRYQEDAIEVLETVDAKLKQALESICEA